MYVLVTYDIQTLTPAGKRRLRHAAKACLDFGQRVQYSVFELKVDPAQWAQCRDRLLRIIDPEVDSVRFYYLGTNWEQRVEHHGAKPGLDIEGPLIL
ncbi:CRISPR-associated endonuclease Cas2 [Paludisphaera borealis]|uniref:CRISPR-associated endoribonuclease Cas2 n=1 Tax=Paludisphaera borealis TaxID=1387353 RepID=A0A1U7CW99_9BACT|nr:CRISPR-associated endonuclease Cas2 [Paludisphaera borealis]APW63222.1 CRISPR-associated endoribonuclease Cas2 [Paludisphaera borealis]